MARADGDEMAGEAAQAKNERLEAPRVAAPVARADGDEIAEEAANAAAKARVL